jgi:hypothetical protein
MRLASAAEQKIMKRKIRVAPFMKSTEPCFYEGRVPEIQDSEMPFSVFKGYLQRCIRMNKALMSNDMMQKSERAVWISYLGH